MKRGFQEVVSPNIYSTKLWETSGHWQHYSVRTVYLSVELRLFMCGFKPGLYCTCNECHKTVNDIK